MSGPKGASYTVSPAELRRMEQERREAERRRVEAATIRRCVTGIHSLSASLQEQWERQQTRLRQAGLSMCEEDTIWAVQKELKAFQEQYADWNGIAAKQKGRSRVCEQERARLVERTGVLQAIMAEAEQRILEQSEKKAQADFQELSRRKVARQEQKPAVQEKEQRQEILQRRRDITERMHALAGNSPDVLQEEYQQLTEMRERLDEVSQENAEQLLSAIRHFEEMYLLPFERKQVRWLALQPKRDLIAAQYSMLGIQIPENLNSLREEELNQLIRKAEASLAERDRHRYVADTVQKCMEEMGYELLGTGEDSSFVRETVYQIHDQTVIHVNCQQDGTVSMEVALLTGDSETAAKELTAFEREKLVDDMRGFCTKYPEIQRRLAEKGLYADKLYECPPDEQYAFAYAASAFHVNEAKRQSGKRQQTQVLHSEG